MLALLGLACLLSVMWKDILKLNVICRYEVGSFYTPRAILFLKTKQKLLMGPNQNENLRENLKNLARSQNFFRISFFKNYILASMLLLYFKLLFGFWYSFMKVAVICLKSKNIFIASSWWKSHISVHHSELTKIIFSFSILCRMYKD